jgi:hypothetical protein
LCAAMRDNFGYMDEGLWLYAMSETKEPVWSDIDNDEMNKIVTFMLKRAQTDPLAAQGVRALMETEIYIQLGAISIPRLIKSYHLIKSSPRPKLQAQKRQMRKERMRAAHH